jgi:hypothetical protein
VFIELTEHLRCPAAHESGLPLVLVPDRMLGRMVLEGTIGCPTCRREFLIREGIGRFGEASPETPPAPAVDGTLAESVQALLSLSHPGGYVVLIGSAVALAPALAGAMGGIHFVGVNPPAGIGVTPTLSLLLHPSVVPLRSKVARGVVVGGEVPAQGLGEGARVLLAGLRLVVLRGEVTAPAGVEPRAAGKGLWVGEKRTLTRDRGYPE